MRTALAALPHRVELMIVLRWTGHEVELDELDGLLQLERPVDDDLITLDSTCFSDQLHHFLLVPPQGFEP